MATQHFTPIVKELYADLETPATIYLKLNKPKSFLLESITGGEQVARYSFIGFDPICELIHDYKSVHITENGNTTTAQKGAIDALEELMKGFSVDKTSKFSHLVGGAVGFFSWETINEIERISQTQKDPSEYPMAHFILPRCTIAFDHAHRKILLIVLAKEGEHEQAQKSLDEIEATLHQSMDYNPSPEPPSFDVFDNVSSNFEKDEYMAAVEKAKEYIYEGDIFQVVLSQKFQLESKKDPFDVYRSLRIINPSPYMYYLNFGDYQVVGSSPEILVRCENNTVTVKPIAGTRVRKPETEEAMIEELKNDEKEIAEHVMLIDLGRNDIGRVCEFNSVKTSNIMAIEKYSHVIHMVSDVQGTLKEGKSAFDVVRATFPAGTLSGTPKVRAMQVIDELEPELRGLYGGALGYFDFNGNMDLCIIIRTVCIKDGKFTVQAGGGIVADSKPELEYKECQNKARGVLNACF